MSDESVPENLRGTYGAFTQDSSGTRHLRALAEAGLTYLHLLPVFDIATIDENRANWRFPEGDLSNLPPNSPVPQEAVAAVRSQTRAPDEILVIDNGSDDGTREWLHQEPRRASYAPSMALVDTLRSAGHAAVISGAGPSVLVLATRESADAVGAAAGGRWRVRRPGIPPRGLESRRTDA